jgi:hypothetical protein
MEYRDLVIDFTCDGIESTQLIETLDAVLDNGILAYHINKNNYRLYVTLHKYSHFWGQIDAKDEVVLTLFNSTFTAKTYSRESAPIFTFKN